MAETGAQGSRPKDGVLRPKKFLISAQERPKDFFAAPQELPEGFFAYPKATKGFSEKIIKQILISLGQQGWGSPNLLWGERGVGVSLNFLGAIRVLGCA